MPPNIPRDHNDKEEMELMEQPEIVGIICGLAFLTVVLIIVTVCYLCRRHIRNRDTSPRCHHCHSEEFLNRSHYQWARPPPYCPPEVYDQPQRHQCACHTRNETEMPYPPLRHSRASHVSVPLRHSGHETTGHMSVDRSLNEFPLLQHPSREVLNPVFNEDGDADQTSRYSETVDPLADLYKPTERSFTQKVCGKLVVSVARLVDHHGDILILDNMGISLKVPEGAIKRGQKQWITLVLNWDLSDNPQMTSKQSLVSPVVYIGPHGLKLEKPCILSYRHCSFDTRHIRVMRSETELTEEKKWEVVCDRDDRSGVCYLTQDECQLKVDKFTLYTCVQTPIDDQPGKKWLQIAVFACPLRREINHHQVRFPFIYITNVIFNLQKKFTKETNL